MKNYSYPRVVTSVTALKRSSKRPEAEDTTVLFVPIVSQTGPDSEVVKIHSLEEYKSLFGLDKDRLGLTLLNISNWLTAGGTLYAYRCIGSGATKPEIKEQYQVVNDQANVDKDLLRIKAKYYGNVFSDGIYTVELAISGTNRISVLLKKGLTKIESFSFSISDLKDVENEEIKIIDVSKKSEYLGEIGLILNGDSTKFGVGTVEGSTIDLAYATSFKASFKDYASGTDGYNSYEEALEEFWLDTKDGNITTKEAKAPDVIGNRLETPIDLIMDAGYSSKIKKGMIAAISHYDTSDEVDAIRPDIRGYFDLGSLESDSADNAETNAKTLFDSGTLCYKETSNVFFYTQSFIISEETYFGEDMTVYPSYYLSSLIPTNDLNNGIQFALAGKRRAELEGVKKISYNPSPDDKEKLFKGRINYVEKDSRGYYFMSQRTFDGSTEEEYTALSFINNSRVTCKMVHELEALGRDYLFEFNDAITLANMSAVMNRYVSNWIANRTLSFGNVEVTADPYSDEKVNAVLNIKFTGTIETISIDLILH